MVHSVRQGEGGEQGDALMPLFFSVGQHSALEATQRVLHPDKRLFAFLDDIYLVSKPERVGEVHKEIERELWARAKIRVHAGKTHVWNKSGRRPVVCDELQRRAAVQDPTAKVWRGWDFTLSEQGIKIFACPWGHEEFVKRQLEVVGKKKTSSFVKCDPKCPRRASS